MVGQLQATWRHLVENWRPVDLLDIGLVAILLYFCMLWLQTRASRAVLVALAVVAAVYMTARWLDLYLVLATFHELGPTVILISLVLVFQNDVRRAFEQLTAWGRHRISSAEQESTSVADMLVDALSGMAEDRIGALVILRGKESLERHIRGGIQLDGCVSVPLLRSIFDPSSPGHDGAVLIVGDRVVLFGGHLPLSTNHTALGHGGTRHAAALGLAERSDPLVLVASEERGVISAAQQGTIEELASPADLKERMEVFQRSLHPPRGPRAWWQSAVRHPVLKIASLLLAVGLWWTFAYRVAPVQRTYEVRIELRNPPEGWTVESSPTIASVTLSGREREFGLLDPEQIAFSLNIGEMIERGNFAGSHEVGLTEESLENVPRGLRVTLIEPSSVQLDAYRWKVAQLPVRPRLVRESLAEGLEVEQVSVQPETIRVRLPHDSEVTQAPTEWIDLSEMRESTTLRPRLMLPENTQYIVPERGDVQVRIEIAPENADARGDQ